MQKREEVMQSREAAQRKGGGMDVKNVLDEMEAMKGDTAQKKRKE